MAVRKVSAECVLGVRSGSTEKRERRMRGVEVVSSGERVLWRRVMGRRSVGQASEGRERRAGMKPRGVCVVGVRINLDETLL